jgi:hypothetical protein
MGLRGKLAEALKELGYGETGGASSGHEIAKELAELALVFELIGFDAPVGDKRAGALLGLDDPTNFEFAISSQYGVGIDGQIHGHLADRGKLIASHQGTRSDAPLDLIDDLSIDRHATSQIQAKGQGSARGSLCHHLFI